MNKNTQPTPHDEDTINLKPSINKVGGGFLAYVTILDSDNNPIAYSDHEFVATQDEAWLKATDMAKVLGQQIKAGYEHYLETGEEP